MIVMVVVVVVVMMMVVVVVMMVVVVVVEVMMVVVVVEVTMVVVVVGIMQVQVQETATLYSGHLFAPGGASPDIHFYLYNCRFSKTVTATKTLANCQDSLSTMASNQ